ncbi:tetratricopeptide repeat protein, partial [Nonomuraea fuscirosea]
MTSSELETPPLDTARRLAEEGDLDAAADILSRLAADPEEPDRAQAAVGLAVVLEQRGDVERARAAART